MDLIEYGYIHVKSGKVVGLRPAKSPSLTALLVAQGDVSAVLERVSVGGWRPENDSYKHRIEGDYQIRIWRPALYQEEPKGTPEVRVASVSVDATEAEFDQSVSEIQHLWEVSGWDLVKIWRKGMNFGPKLFFSKPKEAPDTTPFVHPNA